jgi:cobalt/nickel transport system ATP-binding protein
MGNTVIQADNIYHEYPDGTVAIEDVNLSIEAGEQVAVIGANGSGKSSLQLILGGLVDSTRGGVEYFGETIDAESVRNRLGVLLQDPDDYLFNTTVREDIEYGPSQLGVPKAEAMEMIDRLAGKLGLEGLLDRPSFRLSGGEKQRAAVASVFAFDPDVLLLDEPFGAVDADYRDEIIDLISSHNGTTVLFRPSTSLVPQLVDRVILMGQNGQIVADGDVRDIFTSTDLLVENGLQPPETVQIFEGIVSDENIPLTVESAQDYLQSHPFNLSPRIKPSER